MNDCCICGKEITDAENDGAHFPHEEDCCFYEINYCCCDKMAHPECCPECMDQTMFDDICQWSCTHNPLTLCDNLHKHATTCLNKATYKLHEPGTDNYPGMTWIICENHISEIDNKMPAFTYEPLKVHVCRKQ